MSVGGPLSVGPATVADAPALLALQRRVLEERVWFITDPDELRDTVETKARSIRELAGGDEGVCLVARRGERVVGTGSVSFLPRRKLRHVGRVELMVEPEERRRGVGRALLRGLITWAERHPRVRKLSLQVFSHNEGAIALYRSMGFVEEGRREDEYLFPDGSYRGDVLMARPVVRGPSLLEREAE